MQILVRLRHLLRRNGIKCLENLFRRHGDTIIEKKKKKKKKKKRPSWVNLLFCVSLIMLVIFLKNKSCFIIESMIIILNKVKLSPFSRGWPEGFHFDSLLHQGVGEGTTPFPGLLYFTLDPYLIMLSVKQGSFKYHFLSLSYDSTWDWTPVSRAIGKHLNSVLVRKWT